MKITDYITTEVTFGHNGQVPDKISFDFAKVLRRELQNEHSNVAVVYAKD